MKLSLGENIRRLRRDRDMTQEQLADALAVSFQAVSRWENGSTYPDLELIPAIAEFFSVSTDELLGVPEAEKNRQAEALVMRYADIMNSEYPAADAQKKVELRAGLAEIVKSLRRDFSGTEAAAALFTSLGEVEMQEPILSEYRLLAETILAKDPNNYDVILGFSQIEEDGRISDFLDRYSTSCDTSRNALLFERYLTRGDAEKFEPLRQKILYNTLRDAVSWQRFRSMDDYGDIKVSAERIITCLGIIHTFEDETPTSEHPVSCDGEPDCWIFEKVWHGLRLSCREAMLGETEEALTVLEDVIGLVEAAEMLPEGAKIKSSRFLPDLSWSKAVTEFDRGKSFHFHTGPDGCWTYPFDAQSVLNALTDEKGWAWFDPIRSEPRFKACTERTRRLAEKG